MAFLLEGDKYTMITTNINIPMAIKTFRVTKLFTAILCKDHAADLCQEEICFILVLHSCVLWLSYPMINDTDHWLWQRQPESRFESVVKEWS